ARGSSPLQSVSLQPISVRQRAACRKPIGQDRIRSDSCAPCYPGTKNTRRRCYGLTPYDADCVGNPPDRSALARMHPLTKDIEQARALAEAKFKKAEAQRVEGQKARAEYEAAQIAERKKTARLRELRLAREAALRASPPPLAPRRQSQQKQPAQKQSA